MGPPLVPGSTAATMRCGPVREVVARVLRDFRVAGIVATSSDSVLILDAARLHAESWDPAGL